MKLIIISGPSGSGKTRLAKTLSNEFINIDIIETDSFYRDNLIIKILSIYFKDIYDRIISIKIYKLINTIRLVLKEEENVYSYIYDFKRKKSSRKKLNINTANKILIIEGIFAHRIIKYFREYIFMKILCIESKKLCYERRVKRDLNERGRKKKEVEERFNRSWEIYQEHSSNFRKDNEVIHINRNNKEQYINIVNKLKLLKQQK